MKELYVEGLANHNDRESCADVSNGVREALTAAHAGWVLSPENLFFQSADTVLSDGRQYCCIATCEMPTGSAWSETPSMCGNSLSGNREIPCLTRIGRSAVRIGNPKGAIR